MPTQSMQQPAIAAHAAPQSLTAVAESGEPGLAPRVPAASAHVVNSEKSEAHCALAHTCFHTLQL